MLPRCCSDRNRGGADQFVYYVTSETGHVFGTFDVITDFNAAQGDKINVSQMDANKLIAGSQDWTFVAMAAFAKSWRREG